MTVRVRYCGAVPFKEFDNGIFGKHPERVEGRAFKELLADMQENGLRNPLFGFTENGKIYLALGKQRLWAAFKLGWEDVPCIIWDKDGIYPDAKVMTPEEIESYFDDNHAVNRAAYGRGKLAIQKRVQWAHTIST